MPRPFALRSRTNSMPNGSALMTGIVASLVLLLQVPLGEDSEVFWIFFSMNVVFLLLSYLPMFPAFARLRATDSRARIFRAPFKGKLLAVMLALPVAEIVLAAAATAVPLNDTPDELAKLPLLAGVLILLVAGEAQRLLSRKRQLARRQAASADPAPDDPDSGPMAFSQ